MATFAPFIIYLIGLAMQLYSYIIFDGFNMYTEKLSFRYTLYGFLALYCVFGGVLLYIYIKKSKKLALFSILVILILQFIAFPITNRYYPNNRIYAYRYSQTNNILLDSDGRGQREAELFIKAYLEGKTLHLNDGEWLFNESSFAYRFGIYQCEVVYESDIYEAISPEAAVELMSSQDYYHFRYSPKYAAEEGRELIFYMADDYLEITDFVLLYDADNNAYFLPKDDVDGDHDE